MKKRISCAIDEELDERLSEKVKDLGVSKSAFVAFATQFFLNQLEHSEQSLRDKGFHGVYELFKSNYEMQMELKKRK